MLPQDEVHVWCADLSLSDWQPLAQTLSLDERERAQRFRIERDSKHFTLARGYLRTILSRYLDLSPIELEFTYNSHGKPELVQDRQLHFNVSHSNGLALYAITLNRLVGVDLEYIRPLSDLTSLAKRFFSNREYDQLCSLDPDQQAATFFQLWTCKEAYLKAIGTGLIDLQQVEIDLDPQQPQLLNTQNAQILSNWSLRLLSAPAKYKAALVVQGTDWHYVQLDVNS